MIKKIASLVGQIVCPKCHYEIQWDTPDDIEYINGNKIITCPECNNKIMLLNDVDYLIEGDQND